MSQMYAEMIKINMTFKQKLRDTQPQHSQFSGISQLAGPSAVPTCATVGQKLKNDKAVSFSERAGIISLSGVKSDWNLTLQEVSRKMARF